MPDLAIEVRAFTPSDGDGVIELMIEPQRDELQFAPEHAAHPAQYCEGTFESLPDYDTRRSVADDP